MQNRSKTNFAACILAAGAFVLGLAAAGDAAAQCRPRNPTLQYQVDVPVGAPGEGFVRHRVFSEFCPHEYRDRQYTRYRVVDERGRTLTTQSASVVPLSSRHAYAGGRVIVYGREPGPPPPMRIRTPDIHRMIMPGLGSTVPPEDRPVIVAPVVVGSPQLSPGDSTTVSVILFTGYSQTPRTIEGLGGPAVFGTDTFGQTLRSGVYVRQINVADYVMPQYGDLLIQNMTAPDGTGVAQLLDRQGEPLGPVIGIVDSIGIPERDVGSDGGANSPLRQLVSRIEPLGPDFPGQWLLMPLDAEGMPMPVLPGSVGYTLVRAPDRNDRPVWGAVYRGANGYEVALGAHWNGRLPREVRSQRYSALRIIDRDDGSDSYHSLGRSADTGRWSFTEDGRSDRRWVVNGFASPDAAMAAYRQELAAMDAEAKRQAEQNRIENAARAVREAEQAREAAFARFETQINTNAIWYSGNLNDVAGLGDPYLKRWFDKCGVPVDMVGLGRRVGASSAAFAMGEHQAQARRDYAERNRPSFFTGFAEAMSAYRSAAAAGSGDPWVSVRVTEGGRTTTQVMRQSEYDRRRP